MPKKALVVDNDFFFVEFLTELLEKRGYEIVKAYPKFNPIMDTTTVISGG